MSENVTADNPYTRGLAGFIAGLRYEHIPAEVIARIKLLILDGLGCGIYGALPEHSKILVNTLAGLDRSQECGVWGTKQRLSPPHAVLANGALIQSFELDDAHRGSVHTNSGTLPILFALADLQPRVSGKALLTGAVAAFEVSPRVGMCMGQDFTAQGWHSGALAGFPAAAAASSILGLSEEQTVHALGIAGTQAAGLMAAQYGAMVKRMHAGRAAQGGLYGAMLARAGYTGIANLFECEYGGFCTALTRSNDRFDLSQITLGLGKEWETMRSSLKFYASAASGHTALDAIRLMREQRPFKAEDVERVTVYGPQGMVKHVGWKYQPAGLTSAQMNLPFCAATLLLEGDVFVEQITPEAITNPARIALADKIEVKEDPAITALGRPARYHVHVEVRLKDGTLLEQKVEAARGSDKKFGSEADVAGKFEKLASRVLPKQQVAAIAETVLNLEKQNESGVLAKLLTLN